MANQTQNQQGGSQNSDRNRNRNRNRNRSSNRNRGGSNRGGSNRGGGDRGDRNSRPPGGGGSSKRFYKEKVPRREVKPSLWKRFLAMFGIGKPKSSGPAELPQTAANAQAFKRAAQDDKRGGKTDRQRPEGRTRKPREGGNTSGPKVVTTVVKKKEGKPRAERQRRAPEKVEVTCERLYVGNLSYDAGEEDLENLFNGVGAVRMAEVVSHKHTQRSKGYAFVEMGSIDEAVRAVEVLHDQDFMGRKLVVSGAKSVGPRADEPSLNTGVPSIEPKKEVPKAEAEPAPAESAPEPAPEAESAPAAESDTDSTEQQQNS